MKSFVNIHTSFFVGEKFVDADIIVSVNNISVFIQSFTRFYNSMGWYQYNRDVLLSFDFQFTDYPTALLNKLLISGIKPDIKIITYIRYINQVLSKTK